MNKKNIITIIFFSVLFIYGCKEDKSSGLEATKNKSEISEISEFESLKV